MKSLHVSGRYDAMKDLIRAAMSAWAAEGHDFISHTEARTHTRPLTVGGYTLLQGTGDDGQAECALSVRDGWTATARPARLSSLPIPRRGGQRNWCLHAQVTAPLPHHKIVLHMPSGVEDTRVQGSGGQEEVYRDSIEGLKALVRGIDGPLVITGDWNLDLRLSWVRRYLLGHFPGFTFTKVPDAEPGTKNGRLIDFSLVRGFTSTGDVVSSRRTSDHRGIAETLKETTVSRTPKTDAFVAALRRRGVEVLTHAEWGSLRASVYRQRLITHPHGLLPGRPVDTLWNHITVTNDDGALVGDFKADCREVESIGYQRFGSGVSYNILVDRNATKPRVALGQFLEAKGTHTVNDKDVAGYAYNQNLVALAVAWVGVPGNTLNEHAIEAMVQVRAALIEVGALTDDYDDVPHSLVAAKDCPTNELRNRLADLKARGIAAVTHTASEEDEVTPEDIDKIAEAVADKVRAELLMGQKDAPEGRRIGATLTGIYNRLLRVENKLNEEA